MYDNTPLPDGLRYRTTDSLDVFVTDTALLNAYGAQELKVTGVSSLLSHDFMYSQLLGIDAGSYDCGEVPGVRGALTARLIEYSQDKSLDCEPEYVAVTVLSGRRLLATQKRIPDSTRANPQRTTALAQSLVDRLK